LGRRLYLAPKGRTVTRIYGRETQKPKNQGPLTGEVVTKKGVAGIRFGCTCSQSLRKKSKKAIKAERGGQTTGGSHKVLPSTRRTGEGGKKSGGRLGLIPNRGGLKKGKRKQAKILTQTGGEGGETGQHFIPLERRSASVRLRVRGRASAREEHLSPLSTKKRNCCGERGAPYIEKKGGNRVIRREPQTSRNPAQGRNRYRKKRLGGLTYEGTRRTAMASGTMRELV